MTKTSELQEIYRAIDEAREQRTMAALKRAAIGGTAALLLAITGAYIISSPTASTIINDANCSGMGGREACTKNISYYQICGATYIIGSPTFKSCVKGFGGTYDRWFQKVVLGVW
jgi:hypothetical protein